MKLDWFNTKWSLITAFISAICVCIFCLLPHSLFTISGIITIFLFAFLSIFITSYICMHLQDKRIKNSESLNKYLLLLNNLVHIRILHNGKENNEEDELLDKMDAVWPSLTDKEREIIQKLPSKSIINSKTTLKKD